jgi:Protein of unknown function (DUF2283)
MAHILPDSPSRRDAIFRYDAEAKALYYRLTNEPVVRTVDVGGRVLVDVDADGDAIGIEVLDPPGFSMAVTPCPAPREGGMCGCDEPDDEPGDCTQARCDC